MSQYYGSLLGSLGQATRQGTKESGFEAWAQTTDGRVAVVLDHIEGEGQLPLVHPDHGTHKADRATVTIGGGWTSFYRDRSFSFNINNVAAALDLDDERVERLWWRLTDLVDKLDAEAERALTRHDKRRQKREKAQRQAQKNRIRLMREMPPEEKARMARIVYAEFDSEGEPNKLTMSIIDDVDLHEHNGHTYVDGIPNGAHQRYQYDLTTGEWVLPFKPSELGIDNIAAWKTDGWREDVN